MQKHLNKAGFVCALILFGTSNFSSVRADHLSSELDLFSLPLDQLLNISVVSKQSESFASSPGIVTAYDARELEALGLLNLIDFIHFVPGIEVNENLSELPTVQIRGLPANSNQKILFMLDGVPYWMPENGDIPLRGIPIQSIERIEVIRGPGSVIYGTNASAGVINVVLRKDKAFTLYTYKTNSGINNVSMYMGAESKTGLWADVSAEIQQDNGYSYKVENAFTIDPCFCFPETNNGSLVRILEHSSFIARTGYKGLSAIFQTFNSTKTGDVNSVLTSPSVYESEGTLLGLKYVHSLEEGELEFFSDWNNYYRNISSENFLSPFFLDSDGGITFDDQGEANTRFRNGVSFNFRLNRHWSFLSGAEYEERGTENKKFHDDSNGSVLSLVTQPPFNLPFDLQDDNSILLVEEDRSYEKSLFFQTDAHFDKFRLVAGLRYVDNSEAGSELSPRGSVIYSFSDTQSVKLLYAEGFNAPTFRQSAATDGFGIPLNNKIVAEKIRTWDFAYTNTSDNWHQVGSFFYIEAQDLIKTTNNVEETIKRHGVEYDMQYKRDNLKLNASITYVHQGNGHGDDPDADFASRWLAKLGAEYRWEDSVYSTSLRSAGRREGVDSYHLLNLNYRYHASNELSFYTSVTNVLDQEIMHPDLKTLTSRKVQASDGIGFLLGFKYEMGH